MFSPVLSADDSEGSGAHKKKQKKKAWSNTFIVCI